MKIQRRSLWASQRADWYRDAARTEARETVGVGAVMLAIAAVILTLFGASELGTWTGVASVVIGLMSTALAAGLWWGHKWAVRFGGVALTAAVAVGLVAFPVALLMGYRMSLSDLMVRGLLLVSMWNSAQGLFELAKKPVIPAKGSGAEHTIGNPEDEQSGL